LLILVILDEKDLILGKIENFKGSINPYMPTVPIRGRQNHVALQTSYLRNGKELDRMALNFFKEEEISYNMSKFWFPVTFLADFTSI
jgi:hypothetical protein